jgi:hypothetical protein
MTLNNSYPRMTTLMVGASYHVHTLQYAIHYTLVSDLGAAHCRCLYSAVDGKSTSQEVMNHFSYITKQSQSPGLAGPSAARLSLCAEWQGRVRQVQHEYKFPATIRLHIEASPQAG